MKEVDIEKRPDECQIDTPVECGENNRDTKPDISDRIYSLLNAAEKIAISLLKLNAKLRKKRKKQKKVLTFLFFSDILYKRSGEWRS